MTKEHFEEMHPKNSQFREIQRNAPHITYQYYKNSRFPDGITVYTVDTRKAIYQGRRIEGSSYAKRKLENLFIISNAKDKVAVEFT